MSQMTRFHSFIAICCTAALPFIGGCGADLTDGGSSYVVGAATSGGVTATLVIASDWGSGYTADVRMSNTGAATTSWTAVINLGGSTLTNSWNATVTNSGGTLTAKNMGFNAAIPSSTTSVFGFQGSGSGRPTLTSISVTTS